MGRQHGRLKRINEARLAPPWASNKLFLLSSTSCPAKFAASTLGFDTVSVENLKLVLKMLVGRSLVGASRQCFRRSNAPQLFVPAFANVSAPGASGLAPPAVANA